MKITDMMVNEVEQAIERSISYQLVTSPPQFSEPPRLANERLRSEVAATCISMVPGRATGLCQMIAVECLGYIKDRLDCNAWITFGWLSDYSKPGSYFWKMDADELCQGLTTGCIGGVAEFHAWIMLDSGEIIDPVVYPTLAENFKQFARGAGRCHFLLPEGRPYKLTPGLPLLQYHPQAFSG